MSGGQKYSLTVEGCILLQQFTGTVSWRGHRPSSERHGQRQRTIISCHVWQAETLTFNAELKQLTASCFLLFLTLTIYSVIHVRILGSHYPCMQNFHYFIIVVFSYFSVLLFQYFSIFVPQCLDIFFLVSSCFIIFVTPNYSDLPHHLRNKKRCGKSWPIREHLIASPACMIA